MRPAWCDRVRPARCGRVRPARCGYVRAKPAVNEIQSRISLKIEKGRRINWLKSILIIREMRMALIATMFRRLVWWRKEKVELDLKNSSHSFLIAPKESKKLRFYSFWQAILVTCGCESVRCVPKSMKRSYLRVRIREVRSHIDEVVVPKSMKRS